jgi:hypothetical protein
MTEPLTCPRINPGTGVRCDRPLDPAAGYGPCPLCRDIIAARFTRQAQEKAVRVAQALADGYVLDEDTCQFVLPARDDEADEVIAGDRAGAPARRR